MIKNLVFLFCIFSFAASAQVASVSLSKAIARPSMFSESPVHPDDKAQLSHTQIMFEYPEVKNAVTYLVTVFKITTAKDSVPVISQRDSTTATLVDGLEFGQNYCWCYSACNKSGKEFWRSFYFSFQILPLPHNYRLNVVKNTSKNQGGLIAFDYAHTIFDRKGNPVWFLMPCANQYGDGDLVRDLRVNAAGTVTFLAAKDVFETTLDGKVLWKGPSLNHITKGSDDFYHHGFERLPNGNYMAMGTQHKEMMIPGDTAKSKVEFGTLLEFDHSGKLIWSWNSEMYLTKADLFANRTSEGKIDTDTHLNAFGIDDSAKYAYAGFRNLNRIVKIEMKTGKVVSAFGSQQDSTGKINVSARNGYFWHQHDANLLPDGTIAVYNNDSIADPKINSSAIIFSQPEKVGDAAKIVWKFSCKYDTLANGKSEKGGDVELLPNGDYLINMGTLNRCVEVNKKKNICWDAFAEEWAMDTKKWVPLRQYRAHYVSSLYPCYFTSSALADTLARIPGQVKVKINNEGTEADAYLVDYLSGNDVYSTVFTTNSVAADKSIYVTLQSHANEKTISQVRIRSRTNMDFVRVIKL